MPKSEIVVSRKEALSAPETVISLQGISKHINGRSILSHVTFDIRRGEFVIITGSVGSGKSTVLSIMEGLQKPDAGTVTVLGHNLTDLNSRQLGRLQREKLGIGFQDSTPSRGLTVRENIFDLAEYMGKVTGPRSIRHGAEIAAQFGLDKLWQQSVASLSGGEKAKLALARVLVPSPELLLLDEPTAAADPVGKEDIYAYLRELCTKQGVTAVSVTHDPEFSRPYIDREISLRGGQLISDTTYASGHEVSAPVSAD